MNQAVVIEPGRNALRVVGLGLEGLSDTEQLEAMVMFVLTKFVEREDMISVEGGHRLIKISTRVYAEAVLNEMAKRGSVVMNAAIMMQALERIRDVNTTASETGEESQNRTAKIADLALRGAFSDPGPKE